MEDTSNTMKKHVTLVAALHIGFSAMGLIASVITFYLFYFAGSFIPDNQAVLSVLKFMGFLLPASILFISLFGFIGGVGLLSCQKWSRLLILIIAAIGCLNFPFGTLKGVYSLWVLLQDETVKLFE